MRYARLGCKTESILLMDDHAKSTEALVRRPLTISSSPAAAAVVSLVAIGLLCVKVALQLVYPNLKFDDTTTALLIVFAAVPWFARLFELVKFGDFELRFREIEKTQLEQEQSLSIILNSLMGPEELKILHSLQGQTPCKYTYTPETKKPRRDMLRRMRTFRLITTKRDLNIAQIIDSERPVVDLCEVLDLTALGRDYVRSEDLR